MDKNPTVSSVLDVISCIAAQDPNTQLDPSQYRRDIYESDCNEPESAGMPWFVEHKKAPKVT